MTGPGQRIDKWLWHARMFKMRSLSSTFIGNGKVRVNGKRVTKTSHAVGPGDVLTFALGERVRVLKIEGISERRGPYSEAAELYEDLSEPLLDQDGPPPAPSRPRGQGRPTKRDRRALDRLTETTK